MTQDYQYSEPLNPNATLYEVLNQIERFLERDRALRLQNVRTSGSETLRIRNEPTTLRENHTHLLALLEFAKTCKVEVNKPKVLRVRNTLAAYAYQWKNRYIMPQAVLVSGDKKILIQSRDDVLDYQTRDIASVRKKQFPHIYMRWGHVHFSISSFDREDPYDAFQDSIVDAFVRDAGENWQRVIQEVTAVWDDVHSRLDEIVTEQFVKKGGQERRVFQSKLTDMLVKTHGLIDAPPDAILAIFKLGAKEIEKLQKFALRNKADIDIVTLDDVVDAVNEARVKTVMES